MQNTCNYIADVFGLPREAVGELRVIAELDSFWHQDRYVHSRQIANLEFRFRPLGETAIDAASLAHAASGSLRVQSVDMMYSIETTLTAKVEVAVLEGEETVKLFKIMASDFGA